MSALLSESPGSWGRKSYGCQSGPSGLLLGRLVSAISEQVIENFRPEFEGVDGTRLSTPVKQGREIEIGGNRNGVNPKHLDHPAWRRLSHRCHRTSGHGLRSGLRSDARIALFIASTRSPSKLVSYEGSSVIHSRVTSGPMSSSTSPLECFLAARKDAAVDDGPAVAGITFALYPAFSIVGFAVSRSVALMISRPAPLGDRPPDRRIRSRTWPVSSATTARNSVTAGSARSEIRGAQPRHSLRNSGDRIVVVHHHRAVSGPTARRQPHPQQTLLGGLDEIEPTLAVTFAPGTVRVNPPTSPMASVTPSNRSGRLSTSHCAPYSPPASSSATKANTRSRGGTMPEL